jgi:microcystin-dependent protein
MATIFDTIQFRRGTAAAWLAVDPILSEGEAGFETDTGKIKFGDGLTHWNSLLYYPSISSSEWIAQIATFTYVSGVKFSTATDVTANFPVGIRVKAVVTAGTIYGTVTDATASGSPIRTTVTVQWDSGALDAGLSLVSLGIFSPVHSSVPPQDFMPVGVVLPYGGPSAPTGWLLCYGQAVSRTTYATLFALIGTSFGVGNGTSTFNLPDLRGRMPIGPDNMGGGAAGRVSAATAVGYDAGEEEIDLSHTHTTGDHTLTIAEMPSHNHSVTAGGAAARTADGAADNFPFWGSYATGYTGGGAPHNHGVTGGELSSTQAIMNPYLAINFIIKY